MKISRSATIVLKANIDIVFPLFSALGEKKWVPGWDPEFVFPENGEFELNQVFKTRSSNDIEDVYNWITSYLNNDEKLVIYTVFTQNRVWTIGVDCNENAQKTHATITYTYIPLNGTGIKLNSIALQNMYMYELSDWENALNHYLETGNTI